MLINDQPVIIQIDYGASMNVIPETSCNTRVHMWNKTVLQPRGKIRLAICNPKTRKYSGEFFVVAENLIPLLGVRGHGSYNYKLQQI